MGSAQVQYCLFHVSIVRFRMRVTRHETRATRAPYWPRTAHPATTAGYPSAGQNRPRRNTKQTQARGSESAIAPQVRGSEGVGSAHVLQTRSSVHNRKTANT